MTPRTEVISSNIKSIGYDPATQTLEVEFKGSLQNRVWTYAPVSQEMHDAIVGAPSIGRAFNELVKTNPAVAAADVTPAEAAEAF